MAYSVVSVATLGRERFTNMEGKVTLADLPAGELFCLPVSAIVLNVTTAVTTNRYRDPGTAEELGFALGVIEQAVVARVQPAWNR